MSDETLATKSQPPSAIADADYDAIYATLSETAQGRRFLAEHGRRCRPSDTEASLAAIERMQAVMRDGGASERLQLLLEIADMAQAIIRLRAEILTMRPQGTGAHDATEELDSIVQTTESATSRILAAAEQVQELAWTMRETGSIEALCDELDKQATEIYTACSFQDLTGQRTRKVIQVLHYLEERLNTLVAAQEAAPAAQSSLVQAGVDAVMQPDFTPPEEPKENRQDATLEDISRLMLSIEPAIGALPAATMTESQSKLLPDVDVRPQLSVAERVMAEDDAARPLAEWAVDPSALTPSKPEDQDAALTDWVVEERNTPQPDAEPAWMILRRMDVELDQAETQAQVAAPERSAAAPAAEPALFVAEAMTQLAQELRPAPLLPPPELTFRAKLPGTESLAELAATIAAGAITLRQPHDDAERHEIAEAPAPAAEDASISSGDPDDFLFAPQTHQEATSAAELSAPAEEWKAGTYPHPALVTPKTLPPREPEAEPQKISEADDPLAPIRAMSDEQKIALFS